jgi:membrane protease YdiL (CAAX protease family)
METTLRAKPTARLWRIPALLIAGMLVAKTINVTSFYVADLVFSVVAALDPDDVYLYITIHHVAQLLITLGLMLVATIRWPSVTFRTFGFTTHDWQFSLKWVLLFSLAWSIVQFGVGYVLVKDGLSADPGYPLTARNLGGMLAFQLLLSGTSEEIMFRGLIMTALIVGWRSVFPSRRALGWAATIGATLVFMFDHINFSLSPLAVTYFNPLQQGTALIFGLFYGVLFWKTQSLVGPILAHGLLNGIITLSGTLLFLLLSA